MNDRSTTHTQHVTALVGAQEEGLGTTGSMEVLTRVQAAQILTGWGFPTSPKTLETLVSKGGGPVFRKFGRTVLYTREDLRDWVEKRMGPRMKSSHVPVSPGEKAPMKPNFDLGVAMKNSP
jgi:hypothetical protein